MYVFTCFAITSVTLAFFLASPNALTHLVASSSIILFGRGDTSSGCGGSGGGGRSGSSSAILDSRITLRMILCDLLYVEIFGYGTST